MNPELATAVAWVFGLALWWVLFWLHGEYRVETFRQKMFALRDRLFDDAGAGLVAFDHPSYRLLRSTMNGFIRLADRLSLTRSLIRLFAFGREEDEEPRPTFTETLARACDGLPRETSLEIYKYVGAMHELVVKHLLMVSPIMLASLLAPVLVSLIAKVCWDRIAMWFGRPVRELDSTAMAFGQAA